MTAADFAAAQERVANRRKAREAAASARLNEHRSRPAGNGHGRLPARISSAVERLLSPLDIIKSRDGTKPAFRVGQVDAELLDEELLELLKGQVGEAMKYFDPHLRDDWNAEILLALRAVLFKLTLWDHNTSYGASLQDLRYTDSRSSSFTQPSIWQKTLYGCFSIGGRYAWTKWQDYLLDAEGGYEEPSPRVRSLARVTSIASASHSIAAFFSFLVFLVNGKYRTLLDRLLRLRLTPSTSQISREISFEYLNRQLVWHAFTEFLLFLLPLVGITKWRKIFSKAWRRVMLLFKQTREPSGEIVDTEGELSYLPERTCAICYQDQNSAVSAEGDLAAMTSASSGVVGSAQTDITNPYEAVACGCKYCYVCLAQRLEAEEGEPWTCLRCGQAVATCQPWSGDIVVESKRPGSGKSVSFAHDRSGALTTLDPIPVDGYLTDEVVEHDSTATQSLYESAEWAKVTESILSEGVTDETEDEEDDSRDTSGSGD